ncbi:alcohol dehydrogenase zinc-binding domain-containing protein, partial [Vibrio nigripulchritudo ATCC 27043]
FVRSVGADRVLDYSLHDFTLGERSYDVVFDVANTVCFDSCCNVLKPNGICLKLEAGLAEYYQMMSAIFFGKRRLACNHGIDTNLDLVLLKDLVELGFLRPTIDRRYQFEELQEARHYAEQMHSKGSVVISVS